MDSPISSASRYSITPDDSVSNIGSNSTRTSILSKQRAINRRTDTYSSVSSSTDKCSAVSSRLEDLKNYVDNLHSKVKKQADDSRTRLNESYRSLKKTNYDVSSTSSDSDGEETTSDIRFSKMTNDSVITNNTAQLMNGIDQYIRKCKQSMPEIKSTRLASVSSSDESSKISSTIFATKQRAITGAFSDITDNTDHLLDYIQSHNASDKKKKSSNSSKSSSTSSSLLSRPKDHKKKEKRGQQSSRKGAPSLSNQNPLMNLYEEVQKGLNHPALAPSISSQPKKTPRSRSSRVERKRRRIQRQEDDLSDMKENQQPRLSKELLSKIKQWDGWQSFKTQSSIILDLEEQQQKQQKPRRSARRARSGKRQSKNSSVLYSSRSKTSTQPRSAKRVQSARARVHAKKRSNSRPASASVNHRQSTKAPKPVQKKRELTSARSHPAHVNRTPVSTVPSEAYTQTSSIEQNMNQHKKNKKPLHVDMQYEHQDDDSSTSSYQPNMTHKVWAEPLVADDDSSNMNSGDSTSSSTNLSKASSSNHKLIYKQTQQLQKERIIPSPKKRHPTFDYVSSPTIDQSKVRQMESRPTTASTRFTSSRPTSAASSGDYYIDQSPAPLPSLGRPTPRVPRRSHTLEESLNQTSASSTQISTTSNQNTSLHNVSVQSNASSVACQTGDDNEKAPSTSTMSDHSITLNISRDAASNIVLQIPGRKKKSQSDFAIQIQGDKSFGSSYETSSHIAVDPLLMNPSGDFSNPISLAPLKDLLQRMNSDDDSSISTSS